MSVFRRALPGLVVVVALGALATVLLELTGARGQEGGDRLDLGLAVEGVEHRTSYSVCVAGAQGLSLSDALVERVRDSLERALPGLPTQIASEDCPTPASLTGSPLDPSDRQFGDHARFLSSAADASPHTLLVYFVPEEVYDASFEFAYPYALTTEERVCSGDVCNAVTGGLYVKAGTDRGQIEYAIMDAEGLVPSPVDACRGPSGSAPLWCDEFWAELGLTPEPGIE